MYKKLLDKILEFDNITIFRHARPDGDCTFSSLALYYYLKDNFKDKKIKLAGFEKFDIISKIEKVSDKYIKNSLAIVCDTATTERVDDIRFVNAKYIIKIDHHPPVEQYGNLNIVDSKASATCELLASIFLSNEFKKYKISSKVYQYLYCGIVTDTINFRTTNTTYKTLQIASSLIKNGQFNPSEQVEFVLNNSLDTFKKVSKIRNYLQIKEKFGYILLNKKDLAKIDIEPIEAKNHINEIGNINELNVWAFAVEINGKYDCSLRSKRNYFVNKIASKYNGGGHNNAAAVKQLNIEELNSLFNELIELSTKM